MKSRTSLSLLLLLCSTTLFSQNSKRDSLQNLLDSKELKKNQRVDVLNQFALELVMSALSKSKTLLNEAKALSSEENYEFGVHKSLYVDGYIALQEGSYNLAKQYLKSALLFFTKANHGEEVGACYSSLGVAYKRSGDLDSANYYYRLSIPLIRDDYSLGRLMINIGSNFISEGKLDSAAFYQLEAIRIFESIKNSEGLTIAFLNLGNIFYKQDDFENALKYYRTSLLHAIKVDHKPVQSRNYLNIGAILSQREMNDSALFYFRRAVPIFQKANDRTGLTSAYRSIGEIWFQEHKLDSAEFYFFKTKDLAEQTNHGENRIRSYKYLTELYLEKGDLKKAQKYSNESVALARTMNLPHELQKSLTIQREVYEVSKNFELAYKASLEEKSLSDSIFKSERVNQISELQTKYETEKKDQEIATLSQQAQINELQLKQRNTQLFGAGVVLLVLILGGIVINQRRNFRHKQAVAEIEQRVLRLQMNPHFIFNALTSIQNYIVQSNTKESVVYLAKFSKLMRQILEHSRQEFITVEDEADMLKNYIEIQQLRFKGIFDFVIEIDPKIDQKRTKIPPLFAQPFVENAIEHGFKGKENGGKLIIRFNEEGSKIGLHVIDNGSGIVIPNPEQTEHRSLATAITRERLSLLNKRLRDVFYLEVKSNLESGGTTAKLLLPTLQIS